MHPLLRTLKGGGAPPPDGASSEGTSLRTWRVLHERLAPVIGQNGLGALVRRSVTDAAERHELELPEDVAYDDPVQVGGLFAALSPEDAEAAHTDALSGVLATLEDLVGRDLLARLMVSTTLADDETLPPVSA